MAPLPYAQLIALLETKQNSAKERKNQPEKTARSSLLAPLAPYGSNAIRKTSPSVKRQKHTAPLNLVNKSPKDAEQLSAKPETSSLKSPARTENNGTRNHSPPLKKDPPHKNPKALLESDKKPATESEKSIAKASIPFQSPLTPPSGNDSGNSPSPLRESLDFEKTDPLKRPERKLMIEAKGLPENTISPSQRNLVPQKVTSARRSSWPQICEGQGPRGLCR